MASVSLRHVSKRFNGVTAVKDVNLEIDGQEFLVLLGPSGCGKTTTLRMVAGLEELSEGDIYIEDREVSQLPPKDRDIAMVFQNYALYPHMSVADNMAFGLKLRKVPKVEIDRRVKEAAEILGMGELLARRPRELSGGQRQRVAVGRAIVREPKAFLMDEPLSNLDAKLRTQTRVELKRLHQRLGATILYVTHDQTEAMTMGTRIVVMRDGVVQQVDTPDRIYRHPTNKFVATFVGTPAMNLFDVGLVREGNRVYAHIDGQSNELPPPLRQAVNASTGGSTVTLGLRPEDLVLNSQDDSDASLKLLATVRLVEPLGHENIVHCDVGDVLIIARTKNDWVGKVGDKVTVGFGGARLYAFDPNTGQSLVD